MSNGTTMSGPTGLESSLPSEQPDVLPPRDSAERMNRRANRPSGVPVGSMHVLRLGLVVVVFWSAIVGTLTSGTGVSDLLVPIGIYAMAIGLADRLIRNWRRHQGSLSLTMLAVDAAFLAWVLHMSGGMFSSLRFLVYIHLIASTLIYSYRVGVMVTLMHSVLLFAVYRSYVPASTSVNDLAGQAIGEHAMSAQQFWIFNTIVYWLVALATAPFSSVNERELRRRKDDLSVIAEVANELENLRDPKEIANALLKRICESLEFDRGVVLAVHDEAMVLMGARGTDGLVMPSARVDRLVDQAWDNHEAVLVARLDEISDTTLARLLPDAHNILVAPMFADGQPFGVIVVESSLRTEPVIQRRVISLVMQMASHGALAMRNAWLLQEVQRMADTDALTGVANRRTFEAAMEREVSRSARSGEELTLVLLDLDHFKSLNDSFGHQAGDEMLRKVGAVLSDACRASDTPARYGGEEFALVLPTCGKAEAFETAERLRDLIAAVDSPRPITVSAGVATYPLHGVTASDLVKAADEAMYESKAEGRNRTTISSHKMLRAVHDGEAV